MKTHVEFKSTKFPSFNTEDEGINYATGIYGKRLAEYLQDKLVAKGIDIADVFAEDWGWMVEIKHDAPYPLWIGCNSYNDGSSDDGFLCFIVPDKPYIRRWFKKIDVREDVERISQALDEILNADKEISNIRWWSPEEVR
ncbi:MAG: hypothetical protein GC137_03730 [Alphaproteobacteria bacterium]|nr:hypothetical protein [Alphaproteobacteria bacterium]